MRPLRACTLLLSLSLAGCASLGYYAHVGRGHAAVMLAARDARDIVADPSATPLLRERLARALAARAFAADRLGLPRNRSYTRYVALDRPFVTWSVFATPEFSLDPVLHCLPFAGCVPYRGYFDRAAAEREANRLRAKGNDVFVAGVSAYSTIGWFADPILSSMLRSGADELDGVIFHELAHQKLYVPGDAAFNESWASFVERQGLREWRGARGVREAAPLTAADREDAFHASVRALRERLAELYATDLPAPVMRRKKAAEIEAFRERHRRERIDPAWDAWVAQPIDNARLLPFALYRGWQHAFANLFAASGADWPTFHACVTSISRLPGPQRHALLDALDAGSFQPRCDAATGWQRAAVP